MLAAIKGYYDGNHIIVDENDRKSLNAGDEVIITILDKLNTTGNKTRAKKGGGLLIWINLSYQPEEVLKK